MTGTLTETLVYLALVVAGAILQRNGWIPGPKTPAPGPKVPDPATPPVPAGPLSGPLAQLLLALLRARLGDQVGGAVAAPPADPPPPADPQTRAVEAEYKLCAQLIERLTPPPPPPAPPPPAPAPDDRK